MSVSVERTAGTAATVVWERGDDELGYLAQAVDSGRLEKALTALGLKHYEDLAALSQAEREDLLTATAALATELTRRVRHLTVAAREIDRTSWRLIAAFLVDDPAARGTARSTYAAGLRQMGRPVPASAKD